MKFLTNLTKVASEFFEKNGKVIAGTIFFTIVAAVAKEYGYLSPNYGFSNNGEFKFSMKPKPEDKPKDWTNNPKIMPPVKNSFQEAVVAIWRGAGVSSWESTKSDSAAQIAKLVKNKKEITDEDLRFSIMAMSKIAQLSSWESTKSDINNLVANITSSVVPVVKKEEDANEVENATDPN